MDGAATVRTTKASRVGSWLVCYTVAVMSASAKTKNKM
jgi:hypothetical protein